MKSASPTRAWTKLALIGKSAQTIPTRLTFVDIAGLVRGASKGEGLGNQFLSHIREVDAVAYVLRCFIDDDITHVENKIDPISDAETVETELMLADLDSLEKRVNALEKKAKQGDKESKAMLGVVEKFLPLLREGKPARMATLTDEENLSRGCCSSSPPSPSSTSATSTSVGEGRQRLLGQSRRTRESRGRRLPSSSRPRSKRSSRGSRPKTATRSSPTSALKRPASTV